MVSFHSQRVRLTIYFKSKKKVKLGWHISVIPTLRGWTQEDQVFKASFDYIASLITYQKKKDKNKQICQKRNHIIWHCFYICCAIYMFSFLCLFFICFATLNIRALNSVCPVQHFYRPSPPVLFSIAFSKEGHLWIRNTEVSVGKGSCQDE